MILKSLILGTLFSISIFAVKSGAGLSCSLAVCERTWKKACAVILFSLAYLLLFLLLGQAITHISITENFPIITTMLRSGMLLHTIMALLMGIWGVLLLRPHHQHKSYGWLLLAVPCPMCITVIALSLALFFSIIPASKTVVLWLFPLTFLIISLLSTVLFLFFQKKGDITQTSFLGAFMLLIAGYFFLSATVIPQFADLATVYRMACYQQKSSCIDTLSIVQSLLVGIAAFAAGFFFTRKKVRNTL